jgi:hypothetical protein
MPHRTSSLRTLIVSLPLFAGLASPVFAFVVEQHGAANATNFMTNSTTYVDIPGSEKTVALEAGRVVINWCLSARSEPVTAAVRIRPAFGAVAPATGFLKILDGGLSESICGTWAGDVPAGQALVRLQVATDVDGLGLNGSFVMDHDYHSLTWTAFVLPTASAGVPVISEWGFALFALLLITAATVVASRASRRATRSA